MAEKSQNAVSGKEKKIKSKKEKTLQQQKGLPTLSADLNNNTDKVCAQSLIYEYCLERQPLGIFRDGELS